MFSSRVNSVFWGVGVVLMSSSFYYSVLLSVVLMVFLWLRVPYLYGVFGLALFLLGWVFPLYLSLFFTRLSEGGLNEVLSCFVPSGSPLWISPFVALAETVSYVVRPIVLLIRPFLNITIGSMGGSVLGYMCFYSVGVSVFLVILFFYEIFVALVHWYIVCNILAFSKDH